MPSEHARRSDRLKPVLASKVRAAFHLLEDNLRPEERDTASPAYCLHWYDRLETEGFGLEDLESFDRFVDEMAERALRRAQRTEALFDFGVFMTDRIDGNVLRARQLSESVRRSLQQEYQGGR